MTPPIRFLVLAVGGWTAMRVVVLITGGKTLTGTEPVSAREPAVEVAAERGAPLLEAVANPSAHAGLLRKVIEQAPTAMRSVDRGLRNSWESTVKN